MKNNNSDNPAVDKNSNEILFALQNLSNNLSINFNYLLEDIEALTKYFERFSTELKLSANKIKLKSTAKPLSRNYIIDSLCKYNDLITKNLIQLICNIQINLITNLKQYKKEYEEENNKTLNRINQIISNITLQQDKLDQIKINYCDENEKLKKMEIDSVKKVNNNNLNEVHKNLDEQKLKLQNISIAYYKNAQKMNQIYNESKNDFNEIISDLEIDYKSKNDFYFNCLDKYLLAYQDFSKNLKYQELKEISNKKNSYEDFNTYISKLTNDYNLLINKWKYDININNTSKPKKDIKTVVNNNIKKNIFQAILHKFPNSNIKYVPEYMYIIDENEEDDNKNNNEKQDQVLPLFFESLRKKELIEDGKVYEIMNILNNNSDNILFYIKFCDNLICTNENNQKIFSLYEYNNFTNFSHLNILFNSILENMNKNLEKDDFDSYSIFDKVLIIGEKVYYNDLYLCSLLKTNKVFKYNIYWRNSIEYKIISILDKLCNEKKNNMESEGIISNYIFDIISSYSSRQSQKNINIIEKRGLDKYIPAYSKLTNEIKNEINKTQTPIIIHEVIKCYIKHMANYDFKNSFEVISEIYQFFKINDNDKLNFYVTYNNNCYYNTKKINRTISKHNRKAKMDEKIANIKNNLITYNYPLQFDGLKNKIIVIKNSMKYLNNDEDIIKLRCLSHQINFGMEKKIYKFILKQKKTSCLKHIEIWKSYLHYNKIINEHNYKNILEHVKRKEIEKDFIKIFTTIDIDTKRTNFTKDKKEGRKAINNILKCIEYILNNKKKLSYCQGLNYIAAFLYENTNSEEQSFYIFLSLSKYTKFFDIFKNDLEKLNNYFNIMQRLVESFLPKINSFFIENQIKYEFFLSPFFITLFSNIYSTKTNLFIIKIWDEYIINGWDSFFIALLVMLKMNENKILECKGDELIDFLINKLKNEEMFSDENYDEFEKIKKSFNFPKDLVKSFEDEIYLEKLINEGNLK